MAFVKLMVDGDGLIEVEAEATLVLAGDVTITGSGKSLTANDVRFGADVPLTIATGDVTITGTYHSLTGESGNDQLDGMSAGGDGQLLIIRPSGADDITVVDNQNSTLGNNIFTTNAASNTMNDDDDFMMFIYDAGADSANGAWLEISRSTGSVAVLTSNPPADVATTAVLGNGTEAAIDNHVHDTATGFIDNTNKFAVNVVDNAAMADNAIGNAELADNAVDTAELNTNAVSADAIDQNAEDILFSQIVLNPKTTGSGTTVGTLFYDSDDNRLKIFQ